MRKTKQEFPAISPTYAEFFYNCTKEGSKNSKRADKLITNLYTKVGAAREYTEKQARYAYYDAYAVPPDLNNPAEKYISSLDMNSLNKECVEFLYIPNSIKKFKAGNCQEMAALTLFSLIKNGYTNSKYAGLYLVTEFVNKKTGEREAEIASSLDHGFIVTDMVKEGEKNNSKKEIIVDPWLGFADFKENALKKYEDIFVKANGKNALNASKKFFIQKKLGRYVDFDEYELNSGLLIVKPESFKKEELKVFEQYAKTAF